MAYARCLPLVHYIAKASNAKLLLIFVYLRISVLIYLPRRDPDMPGVLPAGEKKRKRTSIAAPEKRSLEAYFAVQPRPSGERIAAIAEKLDLKKNVVRVWFCNQRRKQKRMKYSASNAIVAQAQLNNGNASL